MPLIFHLQVIDTILWLIFLGEINYHILCKQPDVWCVFSLKIFKNSVFSYIISTVDEKSQKLSLFNKLLKGMTHRVFFHSNHILRWKSCIISKFPSYTFYRKNRLKTIVGKNFDPLTSIEQQVLEIKTLRR